MSLGITAGITTADGLFQSASSPLNRRRLVVVRLLVLRNGTPYYDEDSRSGDTATLYLRLRRGYAYAIIRTARGWRVARERNILLYRSGRRGRRRRRWFPTVGTPLSSTLQRVITCNSVCFFFLLHFILFIIIFFSLLFFVFFFSCTPGWYVQLVYAGCTYNSCTYTRLYISRLQTLRPVSSVACGVDYPYYYY